MRRKGFKVGLGVLLAVVIAISVTFLASWTRVPVTPPAICHFSLFCATQAQLPKEIRDGVVGSAWKTVGTPALYRLACGDRKIA